MEKSTDRLSNLPGLAFRAADGHGNERSGLRRYRRNGFRRKTADRSVTFTGAAKGPTGAPREREATRDRARTVCRLTAMYLISHAPSQGNRLLGLITSASYRPSDGLILPRQYENVLYDQLSSMAVVCRAV